MSERANVWAYFDVADTQISGVRDEVAPPLPEAFSPENDPHVSILPGVELPADRVSAFRETVRERVESRELLVTGFRCYPADEPMVVMLEVSDDLADLRDELTAWVRENGGETIYDPVPTHITLYKAGDGDAADWTLPTDTAEEITRHIDRLDGVYADFSVEGEVAVETW